MIVARFTNITIEYIRNINREIPLEGLIITIDDGGT